MNKKIWSLPMCVRNIKRLGGFLEECVALEEMEWNKFTQEKYMMALLRNKIIIPEINRLTEEQHDLLYNYTSLDFETVKEIMKSYSDIEFSARNYMQPLLRFGLVTFNNRKICITETGRRLLDGQLCTEELLFDALLNWKYPRSMDDIYYSKNTGYNIKPFIGAILIIKRVNDLDAKAGMEQKGITRSEFALFVMTLCNYNEIDDRARKIHGLHRFDKSNVNKSVYQGLFIANQNNIMKDFNTIKKATTDLYLSTIIDDFCSTGLFTIDRFNDRINLKKGQELLIEEILSKNTAQAYTEDND